MDKLDIIKKDNCKRKEYIEKMTLSETRIFFQHRTRMMKNAGNFKNWSKYKEEGSKCKFCLEYDGSSHLMRCSSFAHLRGPDVCLDNDAELVQYLRKVLQLREQKEQEKKEQEQKEKEQEQEGHN